MGTHTSADFVIVLMHIHSSILWLHLFWHIVDGHIMVQEAYIEARLIYVYLKHIQGSASNDAQTEPLFLQWLFLCVGKLWEDFNRAQIIALENDAPTIFAPLLSAPQPELWYGLHLGHNKHLKFVAASYLKTQNNVMLTSLPSFAVKSSGSGYTTPTHYVPHGSIIPSMKAPLLRVGGENESSTQDGRVSTISLLVTLSIMRGSPLSDDSSQHSDYVLLNDAISNGILNTTRPLDNALCSHCVLVMCTLEKEPSPCIADLGLHVLSIIGIEQVFDKPVKSTSEFTASRSTSFARLALLSSWFDMNGGIKLGHNN